MELLYSKEGSEPKELPFRVFLSDGTTRTDPSTFTEEELAEWGYQGPFTHPDYDSKTHKIEWAFDHYDVLPLSSEELEALDQVQWQAVRRERNAKLAACDWTQLSDVPVNKTVWAAYRQSLRDITLQTDPYAIAWPNPPSS